MAYTVNLYQFAKKQNSTAQPVGDGSVFQCKIKDGSDILHPVIILDFRNLPEEIPQNYNYARINEFNRYYWITGISYKLGLWEFNLLVDVLASWKTEIGNQSMYVLRSASNYDTTIVDATYPIKAGATYTTNNQSLNPFATQYSDGYFVCGIINGDSGSYGAVSYYVFTSAQFRAFCAYLLGGTAYWGITEISDQLLKCLYNPFQYVVSCTWVPVTPPLGGVITSIKVGWWDIPVSATRLSGYVRTSGTVTVQVPKHPDSASRAFLKAAPFSQYYLDFPPFGSFTVSADDLVDAAYIDFAWDIDCITGLGRVAMGAGNAAKPFNIVHAQVGVPIQLAQMAPDVMGAVQQMIPTTKYDFLNDAMSLLAKIGTAELQQSLPMQTTGSTGGFMAGYYPIKLTGKFVYLAPENLSEYGRPCCKTLTINTLSGYVQCAHTDFSITALDEEVTQIGSYLTNGFFFE